MSGTRSINDMLMQAARSKKGAVAAGRPPASHIAVEKGKTEKKKEQKVSAPHEKMKESGERESGRKDKSPSTLEKSAVAKINEPCEKDNGTAVQNGIEAPMEIDSTREDKENGTIEEQKDSDMGLEEAKLPDSPDIPKISEKISLPPVGVSEVPSITECVSNLTKRQLEFDPKAAAFWKKGEHVPFAFLAHAFDMISCESGRIAMTDILTNVFRTIIFTTPEDLLPTVYLTANKVAPPHHGVELGIGDATIIKTIGETFGKSDAQVKSQLKALGDLGLVAKACRVNQRLMRKPLALTCAKVLKTFKEIAKETGKNSQENRRNKIKSLLVAAMDCEPLFIVRLAQGNLRIGLAEQTVLVALAHAAVLTEKPPVAAAQLPGRLEQAAQIIKQVYSNLPDFDQIVPALLRVGIQDLSEVCHFTPGVPVGPMLAKATKSISDILDKFQDIEFTCEYKYDGERAQVHYMDNGSVEIYSRNAECTTGKFPDVAGAMTRYKKDDVKSFVLDCEIVAYDREADHILPFQILSTRARKGVTLSSIKVQVCVFAFDLLYLNGKELLQEPLRVRREYLYQSFVEVPKEFSFAKAITSTDLEEIQAFLQDAVNHSCEGLIIKTLDKEATYEPAKRSNNWLKLKKDYMDRFVGDSFDLVPIGAFHGRGKRTGVYGAFLLACYDEDTEEYQSICKIGTGFSEAVLEERSASLRANVIPTPKQYYRFGETLGVDVWFEPVEVWEVKAADLSISPVHRAAIGKVDPSKGISLRFPRLLRLRTDKSPELATTAEQVAEMYRAQKINGQSQRDEEED
ncbi:hypothetical protein KP509_28G053000 [Ceratopteris richardii]|uniref:DNA ligase n=1 Tax=Ceratopteris richardii TaxID=49495 RepID=A0A8T2REQ2_CERRI|nr:hypothetical protein KP509_28G053000 [Ceratopteris richardii]